MYSTKIKGWIAECNDDRQLEMYREKQKGNSEAQFYLADSLLSKGASGSHVADGVWMMESAAEAGFARAMLAMGQMFEFGWAAKKDRLKAMEWYLKAKEAGCFEADGALERLVSEKKKADVVKIVIAVVMVLLMTALVYFLPSMLKNEGSEEPTDATEETEEQETERPRDPTIVLVGDNTELEKKDTSKENMEEINELVKQHDTEEMLINGEHTARVIIGIREGTLDLTEFNAVKVVQYDFGEMVVVQFETVEEAEACIEAVKDRENVKYAVFDTYELYDIAAFTTVNSSAPAPAPVSGNYTHLTWGIEDMHMDVFAEYLADTVENTNVTVAVIDTGSTPNKYTKDRFYEGANFCQNVEGIEIIGPDSSDNGQADIDGHGTHVASTVWDATQGLDVHILPVGVMTFFRYPDGTIGSGGLTTWIAAGIDYAREQGADVINMSLGGKYNSSHYAEEAAINRAIDEGIIVVVAAGNESDDTYNYAPARFNQCITVAAYDDRHNPADFTNYGDEVDVIAPGVEITSFVPEDCYNYPELNYREIEDGVYTADLPGTSMASPHVAALAAMLKIYMPDITCAQAEMCIKDYCEVVQSESLYGAGSIDASMFIDE